MGHRRGQPSSTCNHAPFWITEDSAKIGYPPAQAWGREAVVERISRVPVHQLIMMKRLLNQTVMTQGLRSARILSTVFDGVARHTEDGHRFAARAMAVGFKEADRERDEPFGDFGSSTFKG